MADDVRRWITEGDSEAGYGQVQPDRVYVLADDYNRLVAEKDARIAELEQQLDELDRRKFYKLLNTTLTASLAERTRERDEVRAALKAWEAAARAGASTRTGGTR